MSAIRIKRRAHGVFGACRLRHGPGRGGSGQRLSRAFVERLMICPLGRKEKTPRSESASVRACGRIARRCGGSSTLTKPSVASARRARREVVSAAPHSQGVTPRADRGAGRRRRRCPLPVYRATLVARGWRLLL